MRFGSTVLKLKKLSKDEKFKMNIKIKSKRIMDLDKNYLKVLNEQIEKLINK